MRQLLLSLAVFMVCCLTSLSVLAEDAAPLASPAPSSEPDFTLSDDMQSAYDEYGSGVGAGLDDIKDNYNDSVSDSVLGFAAAFGEALPAEFWGVVGLSVGCMVVLGILSWLRG